MSALPVKIRGRSRQPGGVLGYPLDQVYEEVAYVAYHFHWPAHEVLELEHGERQRWVQEIAKINRRLNEPIRS
ncbi:hypothetical protein TFLX_02997 [Thermoflexales bacterium]|nr:hypothetical protein TFLX_02997 [Thermoflexales bacterium]